MTKNSSESEILTIKEVAEYLKVRERTMCRLVTVKGIPCFKVGGTLRLRQTHIDAWIAAKSNNTQGKH